jgi:hypothetical protein
MFPESLMSPDSLALVESFIVVVCSVAAEDESSVSLLHAVRDNGTIRSAAAMLARSGFFIGSPSVRRGGVPLVS